MRADSDLQGQNRGFLATALILPPFFPKTVFEQRKSSLSRPLRQTQSRKLKNHMHDDVICGGKLYEVITIIIIQVYSVPR